MLDRLKKILRRNKYTHEFLCRRREFLNLRGRIKKYGISAQRTFHIDHDKKLIYLSNSKVACSSIKASMYHLEDQDNYRSVHKTANALKHYELNLPYDKYPDYYKFTFVRNPFARLVSCYVNKLHEDKQNVANGSMQRLYFTRYLFGYLNKDKGFKNWAKRVTRIPPKYADRHFVPQSVLIHDSLGHKLVNDALPFENLKNDFEVIREKYDLAPLPHYNKTKKGNWMDYYDLKTAQRVYKYYKKDIEEFGYTDAYNKLVEYIKARPVE